MAAARRRLERRRPPGSMTSCGCLRGLRLSMPCAGLASCATALSTACRGSSPSSGATFSRRLPWRSSMRVSSPSTSCVILINSGTWLTPCIDDLGRASGFALRLRSNEWGLPIHRPMNRIYEHAPKAKPVGGFSRGAGTDRSDRHGNTGDTTMTGPRPKIAALVADAFQEEEYFFPKIALNEAGYQVEVVSSRKEPVEIYSYFARTGLLDVERAITEARPEDYVGVLIPGGAERDLSHRRRRLARARPQPVIDGSHVELGAFPCSSKKTPWLDYDS